MTSMKSDQSIGVWIITVIAVVFGLLIEKLSISDFRFQFYLGGGGGRSLNMAAKSSVPVASGTSGG